MKKIFSVILVLTMVLSMLPYALADESTPQTSNEAPQTTEPVQSDETVPPTVPQLTSATPPVSDTTVSPVPSATPVPTPVASATAEFAYTQGDKTVTETVTVEESDLSGNTTDKDEAKEYEITIATTEKTKDKDAVTTTEYDIVVTDGEEIATQKQTDDKTTVNTLVDDPKTAVENENLAGCNHNWELIGDIQQATKTQYGIRKYECTIDGCDAVMYVELPMTSSQTETETTEITKTSGTIDNKTGSDPTYTYENNILTVSGNGAIPDYKVTISESDGEKTDVPVTEATPWSAFADKVIEIIIGSGITRIGDFAFANMINLQQVDIYAKEIEVGDYAFAEDPNLTNVNFLDKKAEPDFDNATATVTYTDDSGNEKTSIGSTAFADDGYVSVNYSCVNPNKTEMKNTQKFALANVGHTDLHLNCSVIPGYAPTETEYGRTDGLYCNDCKQVITAQQIIYPNGKAETGKYNIVDFSKLKEVPKSLEDTKYNTIEKVAELQTEIKEALAEEFKTEFKSELLKDHSAVYDIELVELKTEAEPDKHIVNIPYPTGTWPEANDYIAVQLQDDGEIEKIDTFLTNKGIQIEVETLKPVGVAWKNK